MGHGRFCSMKCKGQWMSMQKGGVRRQGVMEKQDEFIKYRINQELRRQFGVYANKVGKSQSEIVRDFIKLLVSDPTKPEVKG